MCGRFTVQLTGGQIHELYDVPQPELPMELPLRYNGAPTQEFAVCRLDDTGRRAITRLRWGLVPFWAKDPRMGARMINARAETVSDKPAFRAAFRARRCLVPASGWFEWQGAGRGKQPWFVALENGAPLSFAALWELWDMGEGVLETFTIVTTAACEGLAGIHHRQPAIIPPSHFHDWLDPTSRPELLLDLVREPCVGPFEQRLISTRVNRVANDEASILEPAAAATPGDRAMPTLFDS